MQLARILRHLWHSERALRRAFPPAALADVEAAIAAGERSHGAQLYVVVEGELGWTALLAGQSARARALEVFAREGVWDTAANNGVLLYLLMADRDVEVVADRGFEGRVTAAEWQQVCSAIERRCAAGEHAAGLVDGIRATHALLARAFPRSDDLSPNGDSRGNELADRPIVR